jgi:hypothetical protein
VFEFGFGSGSYLVTSLCCKLFTSAHDHGMCGGGLSRQGFFVFQGNRDRGCGHVPFLYSNRFASGIDLTRIAWFLDCLEFIFYYIYSNIRHCTCSLFATPSVDGTSM